MPGASGAFCFEREADLFMLDETLMLSSGDEDIARAGEILKNGGLVAIPTETVYGLAANALDGTAVRAIFEAKGRPQDNPLIVHISSLDRIDGLVSRFPQTARALADAFWPGPMTLVLPKSAIIPDEVTCGLDTVGIRFPKSECARRIIDAAGVPLAAPSANTSGKPSPTCAAHVFDDMNGRIDAIVDGGECSVGVESTVVYAADDGEPILLRPGGISAEMIAGVCGSCKIDENITSDMEATGAVMSPGMKHKHYSPNAKITLIESDFDAYKDYVEKNMAPGTAALCFDGEGQRLCGIPYFEYGAVDDPKSQCRKVFSVLRRLDKAGVDAVYARCPRRDGEHLAVYNRLIRAAAFRKIKL